jgi:hypothetical protein
MSPTRRKRATATAKANEKVKKSPAEKILLRNGLLGRRLSPADREKVARLGVAEARALVKVRDKLEYKGTLMLPSGIF